MDKQNKGQNAIGKERGNWRMTVNSRREQSEDDSVDDGFNRAAPPIHNPGNLPRAPGQMKGQTQVLQMCKHGDRKPPGARSGDDRVGVPLDTAEQGGGDLRHDIQSNGEVRNDEASAGEQVIGESIDGELESVGREQGGALLGKDAEDGEGGDELELGGLGDDVRQDERGGLPPADGVVARGGAVVVGQQRGGLGGRRHGERGASAGGALRAGGVGGADEGDEAVAARHGAWEVRRIKTALKRRFGRPRNGGSVLSSSGSSSGDGLQ